MEKLFIKKKLPKFIIVEGLWGTGKTNFVDIISKFNAYNIISEPNHLDFKVDKDISSWYYKEHKKILLDTKNKLANQNILMDRSIVSNAAYKYATEKYFDENTFKNLFKIIDSIDDYMLIFFTADKFFIERRINRIKDEQIKNLILKNDDFYDKYVYFYKKILPKYIHGRIVYLKVNDGNKFIKKQKIISSFLKALPEKDKIKSVCAASLAYYKNKILLLFDHNYNHYVLPQGHKKNNENLPETALREFSEETGYTDLKIIKKIKKYQYHYPKGNHIVYKEIHVFLIEILTKNQISKKLESHEKYSNYFFEINEAIKMAKWKEDRDIIKLSKIFINKKSS
jgi:8-oxo-dGTP pyrophosphatase MutT (NUDIX family)